MASTPSSSANANNNIKTYRHEFGKEFMANLSRFSKVHQYDDRHTYKSEWTKWTQQDEIAQAIDVEKRRLQENSYKGDIEDKMFKAGRYYFRKKTLSSTPTAAAAIDAVGTPRADNNEKDDEPSTPRHHHPRRQYITMSKDTIQLMDRHIADIHHSNATNTTATVAFKPSLCYDDFYQTKMSSIEMTKEIEKIIEKYEKIPTPSAASAATNISPDELTNEIIDKIKKTYKNRYYKFASSLQTE